MNKLQLNRRDFLIAGGVTFAGLTIGGKVLGQTKIDPSGRTVIPFNHKWLYEENFSNEKTAPGFNDKNFSRVTIPHTNKMLPWNGFDEKEYTFVSVYRRHFRLPQELKGKRIFIDFGGVMTAARVFLNGRDLGEYRGGYTAFSFELTDGINWNGNNVLAVRVDSTERPDIPPFGGLIDYLTFGGIYRDVAIRAVNPVFIGNVFASPQNVLQPNRSLRVRTILEGFTAGDAKIKAELFDGEKLLAEKTQDAAGTQTDLVIDKPGDVRLWDIEDPKLYRVVTSLIINGKTVDRYETRIGFREAKFTPEGFFLNGKVLKLRGLNRHQTYPFVGQAMSARGQRRDAWILKKELKSNMVRTSHYPQCPHFLDACDELGLLVFEEIPGWQHIGNKEWQDLAVRDVESMIRRDWNHPSIVLWGVRINESGDNRGLYTRTNDLARTLDDTRQTGGVRFRYQSERLEDVFTMNDFGFPLRPPNHPLYFITETNGHMYPTKRQDNIERIREHTHRHARFHDQIASDAKYAGGLAWCAFDYNTHDYFGSGDRICYHGVSDIFRIPKPAAGFYRSQCSPSEEIVLEPGFDWARGDENETFTRALVSSNCEKLKFYVNNNFVVEAEPDRKTYPNLKYAPFSVNLHSAIGKSWGDLRIEGFIGGKLVIERKMSGKGVDRELRVEADDPELFADGIDMTRVVMKLTDEFGNVRPFASAALMLTLDGPGEIIGDNPFSLAGGVGAVWIKTTEKPGIIRLRVKHARLGTKTIEIKSMTPPKNGSLVI